MTSVNLEGATYLGGLFGSFDATIAPEGHPEVVQPRHGEVVEIVV
jgi:hypothetical protein